MYFQKTVHKNLQHIENQIVNRYMVLIYYFLILSYLHLIIFQK